MNIQRKVATEVVFNAVGDFYAYRAAEQWAKEHGYSCGSICSPMPTAIIKGDVDIAKWKNLTDKERNKVDGVIVANSFRNGPCKILIYEKKPPNPMTTYLMVEISRFRRYLFSTSDIMNALDFAEHFKCDVKVVRQDKVPVEGWTVWMAMDTDIKQQTI